MRKSVLFSALCLCALLLTGCTAYVPLSARAVVKAVYLNEINGEMEAALVVFTCEPAANTSDVTSEARVYTGKGPSIAAALHAAEQQQNKKPFYAQNRLLFLGPELAQDDATTALRYFGAEDVSRASLSVFVLPVQSTTLSDEEEQVLTLVREAERLTEERKKTASGNITTAVHEVRFTPEGKFYGYLPVISFETPHVERLMVFAQGKPSALLEETYLQLALLLSGKQTALTLYLPQDGGQTIMKTQALQVHRQAYGNVLEVSVCGKAQSVVRDGKVLQGEEAQQVVAECNSYLQETAATLHRETVLAGNDIFQYGWWIRAKNVQQPAVLHFKSKLETA